MSAKAKLTIMFLFIGIVIAYFYFTDESFTYTRPDEAAIKANLKPIYKQMTKPLEKQN